MERIHRVRRDLLVLWRAIRPHRESLNELVRDPRDLVTAETRVYLRDCYDHTVQLLDTLDSSREACADLRDFHLSAISYRMNEIMKVLTIFTAVFIPLSFIAGVYGMNFADMPELRWRYGYPAVLALMAFVGGGLLWLFWLRGWLGGQAPTGRTGPAQPPP
jgi:magnesium transporter